MIKKILSIALLMMVTSCTTLQQEFKHYINKPVVSYKSFSVGKVAMNSIELNPTFNIMNKNSFAIPVNEVTYSLTLNNKQMLTGKSEKIGTLSANDSKDITLSIALTKETLLSLQHLLFKDRKVNYQVKGHVDVMGLAIPFEQSATIFIPEITNIDLKVIKANFKQLDIELDIAVNNQNNFLLPLENITYSVSSHNNILFNGEIQNQKIAKGENTITLPLTIKPNTLFSNIFALLNSPILPIHVEINTPLFHKSYDHNLNLATFFLAKESANTFNL
jgi:LEA14-like dessication related protein